jgi:large subunit ribosomal protein L35
MKTHKATTKRFKITGRGKLRRRKQGSSHLRRKKSQRSKHQMRHVVGVNPADVKRIERLLGNGYSVAEALGLPVTLSRGII